MYGTRSHQYALSGTAHLIHFASFLCSKDTSSEDNGHLFEDSWYNVVQHTPYTQLIHTDQAKQHEYDFRSGDTIHTTLSVCMLKSETEGSHPCNGMSIISNFMMPEIATDSKLVHALNDFLIAHLR